jgi:HAD superfamily hydrolase (TIGR01548 family)
MTTTALELGNVIVVRTLSKAYGLAGLRVGYALGPDHMIARIATFGSPYSVSSVSSALACDVLTADEKANRPFLETVTDQRGRLIALLEGLGCAPLPSQANFVLATGVDSEWLVSAAASLGVALRRFPDREDLRTCVRITVPGDDQAYERLESTLRSALAPEAILLDLDGVVADVRDSYRATIIETAAQFGVEVTHRDITVGKAAGNAADDHELTRALCSGAGVDVDLATVTERFEQIYQGDGDRPGLRERERLLPDPDRLAQLSARIPLGIVTARPRADAERFLDMFGIRRLFATVVTREDAPSKPDPAPVLLAMERLGVEHAWMLGDTSDDLAAARSAGVVPIGVTAPGEAADVLSPAARVLGSLDELGEVLDVAQV